jgi:hypothetical protein
MTTPIQKIELGVVVTVVLALVGFAFWLGELNSNVDAIKSDQMKLAADIEKLQSQFADSNGAVDRKLSDAISTLNRQAELQRQISLQPGSSAGAPVIVMEPTWLSENQIHTILNGQVKIEVKELIPFLNLASIKIDIPDGISEEWSSIRVGERRLFSYKEAIFIFDIFEIRENEQSGKETKEVQISIVKKL